MREIDMSKLGTAIEYIKRMAEGKNPINNKPISDESVLKDGNVRRCLEYVQEILQCVESGEISSYRRKKDDGKKGFPYDVVASFQYERDKPLSHIANQLNDLVDMGTYKRIGYRSIKAGLVKKGYLEERVNERLGRIVTGITAEGIKLGIYKVRKVKHDKKEYDVIMYNKVAQKYIIDNLQELDIRNI